MDLSKLNVNLTAEVELIRLGEPTGVFFTLASRDHPDVQAAARRVADKRLATLSRRGAKAMTAESLEAETLDVLCASVLGWRGLQVNGVDHPFTQDNLRSLLTDHAWIRRQLNQAQEDEALFFGN